MNNKSHLNKEQTVDKNGKVTHVYRKGEGGSGNSSNGRISAVTTSSAVKPFSADGVKDAPAGITPEEFAMSSWGWNVAQSANIRKSLVNDDYTAEFVCGNCGNNNKRGLFRQAPKVSFGYEDDPEFDNLAYAQCQKCSGTNVVGLDRLRGMVIRYNYRLENGKNR